MDFDADELLDIVVGDRDGFVNHFRGTAVATLTTMPDITAGGTAIDVGANSAPVVVDWNEDGLLDLVIGSETGTIRLYLNDGTPAAYSYTTYSLLQSGGTTISWYRGCPQVVDLDGDGKKDLVVGENNGGVVFYTNTGTDSAPAFSGYVYLQSGGSPIDLYYGARLWVDDWDEDGLPDLLVSDYEGWVYLYLGTTTGVGEESGIPLPDGTSMTISGSPTSGAFTIGLHLDGSLPVAGGVYSGDGRLVRSFDEGLLGAGEHAIACDLGGRPAGVYFVRMTAGSLVLEGRAVLLP